MIRGNIGKGILGNDGMGIRSNTWGFGAILGRGFGAMMMDFSIPPPALTLILGGVRSGKSHLAQSWIEKHFTTGYYLATSDAKKSANDPEMRERLRRHRQTRSSQWITIEEPENLADALTQCAKNPRPVLVECLTLWLANVIESGKNPIEAWRDVEKVLPHMPLPVIFVSSESGLGTVPAHPASRQFRDALGILHQTAAQRCDQVLFVLAGLAQILKDSQP